MRQDVVAGRLQGRIAIAFAILTLSLFVSDAVALQSPQAAAPKPLAGGNTVLPEIPFASPRAAAVAVPSAPGAWGGARTGSEPTLSDRVVSYQIEATLDPVKHTVDGHERLTWRNRSDRPVNAIFLHLYLNAFEGNGSTFISERNRAGFEFRSAVELKDGQWGHIDLRSATQGGKVAPATFVHPDGGPSTDHTVVRLDLPEAVPAGGSTTIEMRFMDQLPRVVARTGYFGTFHLIGQWFPKIGVLELPGERGATAVRWNVHEFHLNSEFYADYGSFDVHMTVPKGFTVGATGEETEAPVENGTSVTHHFMQDDVHEFAWTADSRTAQPLEGSYEGPGSPRVKVRVLYPPEYASNAEPVLKATIDALTYFSKTLGPYPYKTVTAVIPPFNAEEAGGMEYPTFFTADHVKEVRPDTLGRGILDFVTIHEFGHGYFYGLLGSNEFEEPLLDEGMNEYWDQRMLRERGPTAAMTGSWLQRVGIRPRVSHFGFEHLTAGLTEPVDPTGANSWDRLSTESYGTVYSRTAVTMHDLEERLGKAALEKAMLAYYARWKFRHPSIADLEQSLSESSGQADAVHAAFDQQVYHAMKVDDAVDRIENVELGPESGTQEVDGKWVEQKQEDVDEAISKAHKAWHDAHPGPLVATGPYPFRSTVTVLRYGAPVPETLVVRFADNSVETVVWDDAQRWRRFTWVKPVRAVSAELDPKEAHLLDADRVNNSLVYEPPPGEGPAAGGPLHALSARLLGGPASRRWASEVQAILQNVLTFLTTL